MTSYYTENLCSNPSFEAGLAGWTALAGTVIDQDTTLGWSGHSAMVVETDGTLPGQGVTGPQVTVPSTGTGSMSLYILGGADSLITVSAISGSLATIVASVNVSLAGGDFQRVVLSGLSLTSGDQMYVVVQTTVAQEMNFWVDAVQYEMTSPAHAYIDGSFPTCQWTGFANASASFQPFQFGTSASGTMFLDGRATPVTQGEVFTTSAEGSMLLSGTESGTLTISPVGALTGFGMWTSSDFDPAVSYAAWSNAGISTGRGVWSRPYGMFMAPQQYIASGGEVLWNTAAYAGVGFYFDSVVNTDQQSLADVQVELMPVQPPAVLVTAASALPQFGVTDGCSVSSGNLTLPCTSTYNLAQTGCIFNLTSSSCDIKVNGYPPTGNGSTEAQFCMYFDSNNFCMFSREGANTRFRLCQGGTNTDHSVSFITALYWRIREAAGTIYWDTSTDHSSWTNQYSVAHTLGTKIQTMRLRLYCGYSATESSPAPFLIGGVNCA
jgi:hypothetical protein